MPQIRLSGEPRIESGAGTGVQSMGFKRADPHIDDVYPIMDPLVSVLSEMCPGKKSASQSVG